MQSFLIVYDRLNGLIDVQEFDDPSLALKARFEREALLEPNVEVVVLRSNSLETIKQTHSRYFKSASQILRDAAASLRQARAIS